MQIHTIKKNIIYNIFKTCSSVVFPLIIFPYISRVLQPDNIGKINFSQSVVNYFLLAASLGISTYAIRICSAARNDPEKLNETASQIYSINLLTTILAYILLIISLLCLKKLYDYRFLLAIQSITIIMITLGADWLNSAMEDFKYITLRTFFFQVISIIAIFLFVKEPDDYMIYAAIMVFSNSGANIVNLWYRRRYCSIRFTTHIPWKVHIKPILLLFVMLLAQSIFSNADTTMLGFIRGEYEVGLYSVPVKITSIISQIFASVFIVVLPQLSIGFEKKDYNTINELLYKILNLTITVGMPCITGVFVLAKEVILLAAGETYLDSVPALRILMISAFFSLIGGSFIGNMILLPSKKEKNFMAACCITAMVNIILNTAAISLFGIYGAASTTAFSYFLLMLLLLPKIDNKIIIKNKFKVFLPPVIGCLAIFVFCRICLFCFTDLWMKLSTSILGSIVIYGIVLLITKNEIAIELLKPFMGKNSDQENME